jgi:predicted Zn-dependent protease
MLRRKIFRSCLVATVLLATASTLHAAAAETVEVAPGVSVTRTTYSAPLNQQPFFGFAEKTPQMRAADARFVTSVLQLTGGRAQAFAETIARAWKAFFSGNLAKAAQRFNQAYLIDPTQSAVYHGLGLIAAERFRDPAFADELLQIARTRPNPSPMLNADYGRFLLIANRPEEAEPVLEQAVAAAPRSATAWSNLAWARLHNGKTVPACAAARRAAGLAPPVRVRSDIDLLRRKAGCTRAPPAAAR